MPPIRCPWLGWVDWPDGPPPPATEARHYDFAALLLHHQADPNLAGTTGTAALYAAVDMNSLPWMFGRPELPAASGVSAMELIEALLERGADPDAALSAVQLQRAHTPGDTALHVAVTGRTPGAPRAAVRDAREKRTG